MEQVVWMPVVGREAEKAIGIMHKNAMNVLKGRQKQTKGYTLRYLEGGDA